jgi:hypothetical protein
VGESCEGVVTLDETLKTLKANGVASAELDSCGNLLRVVFEPKLPEFPQTEPEVEADDQYMAAAKTLARHRTAGAGEES